MARAKRYLNTFTRRRIQRMIDAVVGDPTQYDQSTFPAAGALCGTPFCAAGFAVMANDKKRFTELMKDPDAAYWQTEGIRALKLPVDTDTSAVFLTVGTWPNKYRIMYGHSYDRKTAKGRANQRMRAFKAYWQHILDTDGALLHPYD